MKKGFIVFLLASILIISFNGGVSAEKIFDGRGGSDKAYSITTDSSGNVYVAGSGYNLIQYLYRYDWWIKKFNSAGTELWEKKIDGTGGNDQAYSITTDSSGNVYVAGGGEKLFGQATVGDYDWWIKKFNSAGTEQWDRKFDSGASFADQAQSITTDSSENVYVIGTNVVSTSSGGDWWIKKFNSAGTEQWDRKYNSGGPDTGQSITTDSSGNVYVAGSGWNLLGSTGSDWWIKKLNSAGTEQWDRRYDGTGGNDNIWSITTDSSGNVYVAGYGENLLGSTGRDWWIKKFNSAGTEQWDKKINSLGFSPLNDYARSITTDSSGNVYVAGYATGLLSVLSGYDWWIKKFNSAGVELWDRKFDGTGSNDFAYSITIDPSGDLYVAGSGTNLNSTSSGSDWWIKKFNSAGDEIVESNCGNSICESLAGENCSSCPSDCLTGAGEVCCSGIIYTGDCCLSSNCVSPKTCESNVCTLVSTCGDADTDRNSIIEIGELINYISQWKIGTVTIGELITAIGEWKSGCS